MSITALIKKFARDERGVSIIEYALLAALIAVAAVTIMGMVGGKVNNVFGNVSATIGN